MNALVTTLWENLAAQFADPVIFVAMAVALVTGLVRGFAGFGTGMIFMPPVAALYGPKAAAIALWIMDSLPSLPIVIPAMKHVQWKTVLPLVAGYALTVNLGVALLMAGDPTMLRWLLSATVIGFVVLIASGWQYHGPRPLWLSGGVGMLAGFFGGVAQIPVPPVLAYWMAGDEPSRIIRANLIAFMMTSEVLVGLTLFAHGAFTSDAVALGLLMTPPFMVGLIAGQRFFHRASEAAYRRVAYVTILISAIIGLPLWND